MTHEEEILLVSQLRMTIESIQGMQTVIKELIVRVKALEEGRIRISN